ncbi:MAG TPA: hypothetical protein VFI25_09290 [Planctomycetota bacterium]|nr:hypothetical protein [Planctomycetota bacterium]
MLGTAVVAARDGGVKSASRTLVSLAGSTAGKTTVDAVPAGSVAHLEGLRFLTIPLSGIPPALLHVPFHLQAGALETGDAIGRMSNATVGTIRA